MVRAPSAGGYAPSRAAGVAAADPRRPDLRNPARSRPTRRCFSDETAPRRTPHHRPPAWPRPGGSDKATPGGNLRPHLYLWALFAGCARLPDDFAVTIGPDAPTTRDDLYATVDGPTDASVTYRFAWTVDGVAVADQGGKVLPAALTEAGQTWAVQVVAVRGNKEGEPRGAVVTIENSAPSVASVSLPSLLTEGVAATATATFEDADGDAVTPSWVWTADGVPIVGVTTDTLPEWAHRNGQTIQVQVTPNDGQSDGPVKKSDPRVVGVPNPVYPGYGFETLVDLGPAYRPSDLSELPDGRLLVSGLECGVTLYDPFADQVVAQVDVFDYPGDCVAIAVHPYFGDGVHDTVYVWRNMATELWRFTVQLEPSFELVNGELMFRALEDEELSDGHAGGDLLWWSGETEQPALYVTIGNGNPEAGQDPSTPLGSMVAFAEDPATGALVPALADPPFTNPLNAAKGVRNPWRLADCGPTICMADVARDDYEELDIYAGSPANFGWSAVEGVPNDPLYIDPEWVYHHDDAWLVAEDSDNAGIPDTMNVIWVGDRLSSTVFDADLAGGLLVGDHYDGWIRLFELDPSGHLTGESRHVAHLRYVTAMIEGSDGRVYAADLSGTLRRMVPRTQVPAADVPGAPLSLTTYYDPSMPSWPFEIRHPLWSNGSGKDRLLQLPDGARIDNTDPNQWVFPVGTRLWKTFFVEEVAIETRVLERREEGWVTGTYQYADDGEAYFTEGYNVHVDTPSGAYTIPSIASCEECHAGSRGKDFPLGLTAFQLGDDGLVALQDALLLPQGDAPEVDGDALTTDARGYLHGNCAYCHNPEGRVTDLVSIGLDFRFDTPVDEMAAVGVEAQFLAQPGAPYIIQAGNPDESALIQVLEKGIMPPVGLWSPDTEQISDLRDWISTL